MLQPRAQRQQIQSLGSFCISICIIFICIESGLGQNSGKTITYLTLQLKVCLQTNMKQKMHLQIRNHQIAFYVELILISAYFSINSLILNWNLLTHTPKMKCVTRCTHIKVIRIRYCYLVTICALHSAKKNTVKLKNVQS